MSIFQVKDHRFQAVILTLVSLSLLLCNTWIPVPITVEKDLSIPFPCQAKGCGCSSAAQCWENCCCHTDSEKLAWAVRNGVTPPKWFSPKENVAEAKSSSGAKSTGCCCCCSKEKTRALPKSKDKPSTVRVFLILKQQRNCQGNSVVDGFHQFEIQLCAAQPDPLPATEQDEPLCIKCNARLTKAVPQWDPLPS